MRIFFASIFYFLISFGLWGQSNDEPVWWQLERDGKYLEVASHLLFMVQSDSTRNQHADFLHIARMYGYLNDYQKAIFYWKKSYDQNANKDEQFDWYYEGTLAFFERNKEVLKMYYLKLKDNHTAYYKINFLQLKSLYENFDKGYLEASGWRE